MLHHFAKEWLSDDGISAPWVANALLTPTEAALCCKTCKWRLQVGGYGSFSRSGD